MNYVFSTLPTSVTYTAWKSAGEGVPKTLVKSVFIEGGAGVAQKPKPGIDIWTPLGRVTEISDADLAVCEQDPVFQMHRDNRFITVQKKSANVEKVAVDMARRDGSSPMTESDYPPEQGIIVTTDVPKSTLRPGS